MKRPKTRKYRHVGVRYPLDEYNVLLAICERKRKPSGKRMGPATLIRAWTREHANEGGDSLPQTPTANR